MSAPRPARSPLRTIPTGALRAFAIAAIVPVLGACGLVGAVVPPIDVGDPLGVNSRVVMAQLQDGALVQQAASHVDRTVSFDLRDREQDLRGFGVAAFYTNAGIDPEVTMAVPNGAEAPEQFTLSRALIAADLSDANADVAFEHSVSLDLVFERSACEGDTCTYTYTGSEDIGSVLDMEWTDRAELDKVVDILLRGNEDTPNHGSFRVALEVESDTSLTGFTAMFGLSSDGSKIKLG